MKKRILFITESLGIGGAQKIIVFVANQAVKAGYDVTLMAMQDDDNIFEIDSDIEMIAPAGTSQMSLFKRVHFFRKILAAEKFDGIINFPISQTSALVVLGNKAPLLTSERGAPSMYPFLGKLVMKYIFLKSKLVGFQTPMAQEYYPFLKKNKTFVIPNPIFFDKDGQGETFKRRDVISVGRFDPVKKFDNLIQSFIELHVDFPDERLVIYGDGPQREWLESMIANAKAEDYIKLPGKIKITPDFYKQAKIFVLSSQYEGIPNTLLEALSTGTPIVSTDCEPGGARFLTKNGTVGGVVVPFNDVEALKNSLYNSLKNYDEAAVIGELGQYVNDEFAPDIIAKQWLVIIDKLVEES
jgi:glycosyltransferase involved in cell wall biosynthesis